VTASWRVAPMKSNATGVGVTAMDCKVTMLTVTGNRASPPPTVTTISALPLPTAATRPAAVTVATVVAVELKAALAVRSALLPSSYWPLTLTSVRAPGLVRLRLAGVVLMETSCGGVGTVVWVAPLGLGELARSKATAVSWSPGAASMSVLNAPLPSALTWVMKPVAWLVMVIRAPATLWPLTRTWPAACSCGASNTGAAGGAPAGGSMTTKSR
jgi:hypothetical protein